MQLERQIKSESTLYDPSRLRLKIEAFSSDVLLAEVFSRVIEDIGSFFLFMFL